MRLIDADEFEDALENTEYDISPAYEPDGYSHKLICEVLEETPTVDAVPVSELLNLRDELYEKDQITMCGLKKLNQLIAVYSSQLKEREHPIESTPLNQEERWMKTV